MGKGSKPRPFSVSQEHYASEYDRIFAKPKVLAVGDGEMHDYAIVSDGEKLTCYIDGEPVDELAGNSTTYEEASKDEIKLYQEKMEGK